PLNQDVVRPQRLAAPVASDIEQFSAHPLESDAAELYGPPDGYIDPETDEFSVEPQSEDAIPVYEVTLYTDDGLFMLPYMALQENGQPWDSTCTESGATYEFCRQP